MKLTPVSRAVLKALVHCPMSQMGLHVTTGRRVTYPLLDRLRDRKLIRYDVESYRWHITDAGREAANA